MTLSLQRSYISSCINIWVLNEARIKIALQARFMLSGKGLMFMSGRIFPFNEGNFEVVHVQAPCESIRSPS